MTTSCIDYKQGTHSGDQCHRCSELLKHTDVPGAYQWSAAVAPRAMGMVVLGRSMGRSSPGHVYVVVLHTHTSVSDMNGIRIEVIVSRVGDSGSARNQGRGICQRREVQEQEERGTQTSPQRAVC